MRRQADTRTDLDAPETPLSGDIAACSLAVTYAERQKRIFTSSGAMHMNIQPVRRAVTGDCYAANDAKGS
jgi:hypothetical protein